MCDTARLAAGVRKRKDGKFEKRFTVDGKRYSIYANTQKEIAEKEQEIRKQIEAGIYTANRNITLDDYFEEWLKRKRLSVKGNTLKTYTNYYKNHISPRIGTRKVQKIERREIINLQQEVSRSYSKATTNRVMMILKTILNSAVQDEIITKNPADGIKALKETEKASETYHRALTEEEQRIFMQELESDHYYEFIAMLLCTGMRYGEAAALTWSDIDYKKNVIHVTKTLTFTEDNIMIIGDSPKSSSGKRDIPMNDAIRGILQRQRSKLGNIVPINQSSIFVSVYGGMVYNRTVNLVISNTLKRLDAKGLHIDHFTAHALRDTFATRFIEQGGQPQTLKTILGHSSLAMTMDLYAHVLPNTKQKEMDNLKIVF